jgi:hypothetical protein
LAGRTFRTIDEATERALRWSKEEIGMEVHGTTQRRPWEVFLQEEVPTLRPLPAQPFECPQWKECTVHPDHHIVFDRSYYSLPTRYIGREVWARGDTRLVKIFLQAELIKFHARAERPGTWRTDPRLSSPRVGLDGVPPVGQVRSRPKTEALVKAVLNDHAMRNLRKAQAILRLADKYGSSSMEAAAERALFFGNFHYRSLKLILEKGWDLKIPVYSQPPPLPPAKQSFADWRSQAELGNE